MRQKDLDGVPVFVAVAHSGSFSGAARRLGISPSAVSQAVGALERRLGTPLFHRTTRSVRLTETGQEYLAAVGPALEMLRRAATEASGRIGRVAGPLKLTMPRAPFELVVAPVLRRFQEAHPDVELEIAVEARLVDIVKEGFDAGLRYGNCLEKDMVAIPIASADKAVLVASPAYLTGRTTPESPADLAGHRAIMCRSQITGAIIPWTLVSEGESVDVMPAVVMVVHDLRSQLELAVNGLGVLSAPAEYTVDLIEKGILERVLPTWLSPMPALYLYFPNRRHQSASLRAFIRLVGMDYSELSDAEVIASQ